MARELRSHMPPNVAKTHTQIFFLIINKNIHSSMPGNSPRKDISSYYRSNKITKVTPLPLSVRVFSTFSYLLSVFLHNGIEKLYDG